MRKQDIEIDDQPEGRGHLPVKGVKGGSCLDETKFLEQALGGERPSSTSRRPANTTSNPRVTCRPGPGKAGTSKLVKGSSVSNQDDELETQPSIAPEELRDELAKKYDPERLLRMVAQRAGKGESLDHRLRSKYEKRFGVDLGARPRCTPASSPRSSTASATRTR